eukprot:CAMPEP_0185779020 /NCGR_PEP_ID=MMETSP1174-20130828/94392_1 /TAXON_ID=35687 /ORGANISM="Dictyocha speculum, Strain CCMP1381" /LENGTH=53 /DNA_ID=CAMNT_0028467967 /DNA_START=17 /DNA_END=175 /DNA_ORIENTATION=+
MVDEDDEPLENPGDEADEEDSQRMEHIQDLYSIVDNEKEQREIYKEFDHKLAE